MQKYSVVNLYKIRVVVLSFFLITLSFPTISRAQDTVGDVTRQIVEGRENVAGYVADIKDNYKPTDKKYLEAKKRYRTALSKYNGWAASVKRAIRQGKIKDMQKDAGYKKAGEDASAAAKDFVTYVDSLNGESKGGFAILAALVESGIKIWNAYKDRKDLERQKDADAFYEDVKWDQWEMLVSGAAKGLAEDVTADEFQSGDPLDENSSAEFLALTDDDLVEIDTLVSGESKGPKVDSKLLAMETLKLAKEYVRMGVSRKEPPTPTKVKSYLSLYGLPFRYGGNGQYVPYCAAGVGFAATRAYYRLIKKDPGDDFMALRDGLSDVTRDYTKTHPATNVMMNVAKTRTYPDGQSYWVSYKETPKQGWLVFFNWAGNKSKTQHVGIVDSVSSDGRILHTVEFNTSDTNPSNGGRVAEKTRSVRYVVGYIRTYPSN